jgi:hypothetical protein
MSEPHEVPVNKWPINQAALAWLRQAKEHPEPAVAYLAQLARWGLDNDQVQVSPPISPQQPQPESVREFVARLVLAHGPVPAERATRLILSNPSLTMEEQRDNLLSELQEADDPEQAAQLVVRAIYDLMVVVHP